MKPAFTVAIILTALALTTLAATACSGDSSDTGTGAADTADEEERVRERWLEVGLSRGYSESQVECAWQVLRPEEDLLGMIALYTAWEDMSLQSQLNAPLGQKVAECGVR